MTVCMDMALKHDLWLHCCYTNTQACCSKTSYFTPWFFTIATSSRAYPTHIHQWCRAMEVRKHKWIKRPARESRITIFYLFGPFKPICRKNCKEYSSNANEKKKGEIHSANVSFQIFLFFPSCNHCSETPQYYTSLLVFCCSVCMYQLPDLVYTEKMYYNYKNKHVCLCNTFSITFIS